MSRRLRLAARAQDDLRAIIAFTSEVFGQHQADIYAEAIATALSALCERDDLAGSRSREDVAPDLRSFHIGRLQPQARHVVYFRASKDIVRVARILHESMDVGRHIRS